MPDRAEYPLPDDPLLAAAATAMEKTGESACATEKARRDAPAIAVAEI